MPININDSKKINNDVIINYNYASIPIYINQFENTLQSDGFIKIPYVSNSTDPNVVTVENNISVQYKTSKLYIIKSQNIVRNVSYSAELIVEHKSTTNDSTLYTCFLLDSNNNLEKPTNIDQLILDASNNGNNNPNNKEISLQSLVYNNKNNKTIYYKSNNKKIIIFTNPFPIQTVFDSSFANLTPGLFPINPEDYKIIEPMEGFQTRENLIEGFTKNMYCQPVDMTDLSGGSITKEPELSIPLDGNYIKNASTNTIVKTAINFVSFVLVLSISYLIIPIIYNDYVIGLIEFTNPKSKMNRIRSIDIYICVIFIMVIFSMISQGITDNNTVSVIMGFFIGLFFIISFVIIQSKKITTEWLRNTFNESEPAIISTYYTNISVSDDFFNFIYDNFIILFRPFTNIFLFFFIYSTCVGFLALMGSFKEKGLLASGNGFIYILLFSIYLTIVIESIINKSYKK